MLIIYKCHDEALLKLVVYGKSCTFVDVIKLKLTFKILFHQFNLSILLI